jgi:hypothetical protein
MPDSEAVSYVFWGAVLPPSLMLTAPPSILGALQAYGLAGDPNPDSSAEQPKLTITIERHTYMPRGTFRSTPDFIFHIVSGRQRLGLFEAEVETYYDYNRDKPPTASGESSLPIVLATRKNTFETGREQLHKTLQDFFPCPVGAGPERVQRDAEKQREWCVIT